ncbi:MAG: TolC family protein, partial [Acidobacteriota bacterium]
MAISRPKLIAFILAAVFAATAAPRAASPAPPLTLDQLTKMAMENNPGYKASLETLHAASETVGIEKSAYFPNVGFHFGYQRFATHLFLPDAVNRIPGFSAAVGPFDRWGTSVQASYTLFDSGRRKSKLTAARDLQAASRQGTEWDRQDLLFSVHQAYYSLLAARERVTVAEQSLSRSEAHLKLAQARREAADHRTHDSTEGFPCLAGGANRLDQPFFLIGPWCDQRRVRADTGEPLPVRRALGDRLRADPKHGRAKSDAVPREQLCADRTGGDPRGGLAGGRSLENFSHVLELSCRRTSRVVRVAGTRPSHLPL